ncbi:MAG TPA: hypothetical protein VGO58_12075 [Chitinophagaceae bacterium]|jgi:hypothetical protein|nr:hypothetical protein [Chitinophagaceae bacterium]
MKLFISLLIAAIICSCKNEKKETPVAEKKEAVVVDTTLLTDSSWGLIAEATDLAGLQNSYGISNVKDDRICGAECIDSVDVTLVYPGTSKEFIVYWEDSFYHKKIALIRCYTAEAPYHTANGIKMGTTLSTLLQLNGKPVAFSGFGWDYGGGIISLNNGELEKSNVHFNLAINENVDDNSVYGDTELNSDMPSVKKVTDKIYVTELFLSFNNQDR